MLKKIITLVALMFIVFNAQLMYAETFPYSITYVPSTSYLKPGDEVTISFKLNGAPAGLGGFQITLKDVNSAFEKLSDVNFTTLPKQDLSWAITNYASDPYKFGFDSMGTCYSDGEIIATLRLKVKPDFKGNEANISIHNLSGSDMVGNEYLSEIDRAKLDVNLKLGIKQNQDQQLISTVKYALDPAFIVTIPAEIIASDTQDTVINISGDVNLEDGKQVVVYALDGNVLLERHRTSDGVKLDGLAYDSISTKLALKNNQIITNENIINTTPLAMFRINKQNELSDKLVIKNINPLNKKAGLYKGNIVFNIKLENII